MTGKTSLDNIKKSYKILDVPFNASVEEIRRKYRLLIKTYHPDVCKDISPEEANKRIREITEAYKTIMAGKSFERIYREVKSKSSPAESSVYQDATLNSSFKQRKTPTVSLPTKYFLKNLKREYIYGLLVFITVIAVIYLFLPDGHVGNNRKITVSEGSKVVTVLSESVKSSGSKISEEIKKSADLPAGEVSSSPSFFTLGSTEREVLTVQGIPERKSGQVWHYGLSRVIFRDGRVVGYDNFDGSLRVRLIPGDGGFIGEVHNYFTLGSTRDEVILVQGTPSRVTKDVWYYGMDRIFFGDENGNKVVKGYDNVSGALKVKINYSREDSIAFKRGYFTVGDTQEDVIALQGIPQRVEHNRWFYGAFYVIFDKGRVLNVGPVSGDGGGVLKFLAQQPPRDQNGVKNEH